MDNPDSTVQMPASKGFTGAQVSLIVILTVLLTAVAGWWLVRTFLFPEPWRPVQLTMQERVQLDDKLRRLGIELPATASGQPEIAVPEPYRERAADREVVLTQRELNGLLARDPAVGSRVAIDLTKDLASVVALIPVPPDFPVMPGRTVRVTAGAELAFAAGRPVVMLKGVSVMGVPIPNAWLGNLKNVDLVREFGGNAGFWKAFADGVEEIRVQDGRLYVRLRE